MRMEKQHCSEAHLHTVGRERSKHNTESAAKWYRTSLRHKFLAGSYKKATLPRSRF